jgi:hypothetical protein
MKPGQKVARATRLSLLCPFGRGWPRFGDDFLQINFQMAGNLRGEHRCSRHACKVTAQFIGE